MSGRNNSDDDENNEESSGSGGSGGTNARRNTCGSFGSGNSGYFAACKRKKQVIYGIIGVLILIIVFAFILKIVKGTISVFR
jgi:hypothetical protein